MQFRHLIFLLDSFNLKHKLWLSVFSPQPWKATVEHAEVTEKLRTI